jgi:adenylosuccinate lyase
LTRGNNKIDKKGIHKFIDGLKVNATIKKELKAITPHNYTGVTADY